MSRFASPLAVAALALAACGGSTTTETTAGAGTTSTAAATSSTSSPATTEPLAPGSAMEVDAEGRVTIDWGAIGDVFFAAPVPTATDPLFFIHNDPAADGFYFGLEAYTVYGTEWTGQLGTFAIDCSSPSGTGICVHFDPDGPGPEGDLGSDFLVTGTIEILRADIDGFRAVLTDVAFTDGTTIPGPLEITAGETITA